MSMSLQEWGEKTGFEDGWHDAMKGNRKKPHPEAAFGVLEPRYTRAYKRSYDDGYETGREERARREELKNCKSHIHEVEHEREDV